MALLVMVTAHRQECLGSQELFRDDSGQVLGLNPNRSDFR